MRRDLDTARFGILLVTAILAIFSSRLTAWAASSPSEGSYVYYGYAPSRIWRNVTVPGQVGAYMIDPVSIRDHAFVAVVGNHDGTTVQAYLLPEGTLMESFRLDRLETKVLTVRNGSFFKLVADRPTSVFLVGGLNELKPAQTLWVSTFYTSTQGGYVGKEFIFTALQGEVTAVYVIGFPHRVYALEESTVTVWTRNGSKTASFTLHANTAKELPFVPFEVYRLESTGNVMVQAAAQEAPAFYPAVKGGFVGTLFYGAAHPWSAGGGEFSQRWFALTAGEPADVTIVDLQYQKKFQETKVDAGANESARITVRNVGLESTKPIMLFYRTQDADGGIAYGGLQAGQTAYLDLPVGEAYLFAGKETVVTLDDAQLRLLPDGMLPIPVGVHKLSTTEPVAIEVVIIATTQGLGTFGQCIPSIQGIAPSNEALALRPLLVEEPPWLYIAAAAIIIAAFIAFVQMRKRKSRK